MNKIVPLRQEQIDIEVPSKSLQIGWFPQYRIELSFWHNGKKLKDEHAFSYHSESVIEEAMDMARALCFQFGISKDSSLELCAFLTQSEVPKIKHPDDHRWIWPASNEKVPDEKRQSQGLMWSSARGVSPRNDHWAHVSTRFEFGFPLAGDDALNRIDDIQNHFDFGVEKLSQEAQYEGLGLASGEIQDLLVTRLPIGRGACATGIVRLRLPPAPSMSPRNGPLFEAMAITLARRHIDISCHPKSNAIYWDMKNTTSQSLVEWSISV